MNTKTKTFVVFVLWLSALVVSLFSVFVLDAEFFGLWLSFRENLNLFLVNLGFSAKKDDFCCLYASILDTFLCLEKINLGGH